jgi:hypothetical protein
VARRRPRRTLKPLVLPDAVLLDSEGLSAAARGDARTRAELALAERILTSGADLRVLTLEMDGVGGGSLS